MKNLFIQLKKNYFIAYILLLISTVGTLSFLNLKLIPIDGLLQTFNASHRLNIGQVPYRDFFPYLGLGPTVTNYLGEKILGGTLVSQFVFVNTFHLLIGIFILYVCFEIFLDAKSKQRYLFPTAIGLTGIYLYGLQYPFKSIFFILAEYTRPGNSALGLRALILFLTTYICFKAERKILVLFGYFLLGVSFTWSVDYALATLLIGSAILRFPLERNIWAIVRNFLLNLFIGSSIGGAIVLILTKGNLNNWFNTNYLTQKNFQYWYFGIDENFVYGIKTIPFLALFVISMALAILYLLPGVNKMNFTRFLLITGSTFVGMVSQINSAPSPRYLVFALMVNIFAFIGICRRLIQDGIELKNLKIKINLSMNFSGNGFGVVNEQIRKYLNGNIKLIGVMIIVLTVIANITFANQYMNKNIFVPKLGGYVDPRLIDAVRNGEILAKLKNTNVLSTYSGITNIVAEKLNPTKTDYIIHAFTNQERAAWINALKDRNTKTVITTRSDVLLWEPWIAKANWWFYFELLKQFKIKKVGDYEVYWKRKNQDELNERIPQKFSCSINPIDNSKSFVSVLPTEPTDKNPVSDLIISIAITYKSHNNGNEMLMRNRVTITPMNELVNLNSDKPNSFLNVGAPRNSDSYQTFLKYSKFSSNQLLIKSSPEQFSNLEIDKCRIISVYEYSSLFPTFPSSKLSFEDVTNDFRR